MSWKKKIAARKVFFPKVVKINKPNVNGFLNDIIGDNESQEDVAILEQWLELNRQEGELRTQLKKAESDLDNQAYAQDPKLSVAEIQTLIVDDKVADCFRVNHQWGDGSYQPGTDSTS